MRLLCILAEMIISSVCSFCLSLFWCQEGSLAIRIFSGMDMNYCLLNELWKCTLPPKTWRPRSFSKRSFECEKLGFNSLNLSNFPPWSFPFLNSHSVWEVQLALGHFLHYSTVVCAYKSCNIQKGKCIE